MDTVFGAAGLEPEAWRRSGKPLRPRNTATGKGLLRGEGFAEWFDALDVLMTLA